MIIQDSLFPYRKEAAEVKFNEARFHSLAWPVALLRLLGSQVVTVRITLSYFIEPSPGRLGWTNRFRYPSHGLRFKMRLPSDTETQFRQRVTKEAWSSPQNKPSLSPDSGRWLLGNSSRNRGCLLQDEWSGTAADLAECGTIAVFPVNGWWRSRKHLARYNSEARYSLIISLKTEPTVAGLTLYQSCKALLAVPVNVEL